MTSADVGHTRWPEGGGAWLRGGVLIGLVALAALHVAAWADHPLDVDPINFTMALGEYDLGRDSPHPPGYPLYVGLGRLSAMALGTSRAYQAVNLAILLASTVLIFSIGRRIASPAVGLAAAALYATHPLAWAATVVPECYASDALGAAAIVACALAGGRRPRVGVASLACVYFAVGLTRPTSCVLLLPVALVAGWIGTTPGRSRLRYLVMTTIAALTSMVLAYALTVMLAGGPAVYKEQADRVMGAAFRSTSLLAGAPARAHLAMVAKLGVWFVLLACPVAVALIAGARRGSTVAFRDGAPLFALVAAWIAPALSFYALIYYLKPTYQLIYLPALQLLLGWALWRLMGGRFKPTALIALALAAVQLGLFWLGGPGLPSSIYRLTRSHVARQDAAWDDLDAAVGGLDDDVLVVYRSHPQIPVQALRIIARGRPFAAQGDDGLIHLNVQGRWKEAERGDLDRYRSSVVVSSEGGKAQFEKAGPPATLIP